MKTNARIVVLLAAAILLTLLAEVGTAAEMKLRWSVKLPVRQTAWQHVRDMQRDTAYRASAAGGLVFVGCEHNGALLALDAKTGGEKWRYYTNGAIRTQPAADEKHVLFGSDDGHVYCLSHDGKLKWKQSVGQGQRFVIGHQRMTSAWPVATHPLLADGKLFVMGGVWPADGVFMHGFDVESGKLLWRSPSMAMRTMLIPHWVEDGHVYVQTYSGTGGKSYRFDMQTGVPSAFPKGTQKPVRETVSVPGAQDLVGSNASGGLVFGTGEDGTLYCAGPALNGEPQQHARELGKPAGDNANAKAIIEAASHTAGYALVEGLTDGSLVEGLIRSSDLYVVAVDADAAKVDRIRRDLDRRGCFATHRLSVLSLKLADDVLPPYFASIVLSESGAKPSQVALTSLRPYGGATMHKAGNTWQADRRGALAGTGNWSHEYANAAMNNSTSDSLVKAPLGVLWYGGPASERKYFLHGNRPAGALIVDGRMFLQGDGVICGVDAYTGRLLWEAEIPSVHVYNGTHGSGNGSLSRSTPWDDPKAAEKDIAPTQHSRATGLNWAAASDCIYLFAGERCLRFNTVTGEELPAWNMPLPKAGGEALCWGHPRVMNDYLVATALKPSDLKAARIGSGGNGGDWASDRTPMSHVFAVDRESGRLLWSHAANLSFNNRAFVVSEKGRVFCTDLLQTDAAEAFVEAGRKIPEVGASLRAFDLKSGKDVWTKELDRLVKYINYVEKDDMLLVPNRYGRQWTGKGWGWPGLSEEETKKKSGRPDGIFRAYQGQTGELVWEISEQHYDGPFSVIGDKILNRYGTAFDPATGKLAMRRSPVTGEQESYGFKKSGCAVLGGCDSLVAWRTAYHDMTTGTSTKLPGFEAGCTTSLQPASGILNMPNFGMFHLRARAASLAMAHRPSAKPWSSYQFTKAMQETPIEQIGFNLGAPGDRYDERGTLWMRTFNGGDFRVAVEPKVVAWFNTGDEADWIGGSGAVGLTKITLPTALNQKDKRAVRRYDVKLYFSDAFGKPGERVFDISLEGEQVGADFDPAGDGAAVKTFTGVEVTGMLDIELTAKRGQPILCGVEISASPAASAQGDAE